MNIIKEGTQIFLIIILFMLFTLMVINISHVAGRSMEPTLTNADVLIVHRYHYGLRLPFVGKYLVRFNQVQRGDVVIVSDPSKETYNNWVKRVVGIAGDSISIINNYVYLNSKKLSCVDGEKITENIMSCEQTTVNGVSYTVKTLEVPFKQQFQANDITIPEGYVFVLGDNRAGSRDSRDVGLIAMNEIIGKQGTIFKGAQTVYKRSSLAFIGLMIIGFFITRKPKQDVSIKYKGS